MAKGINRPQKGPNIVLNGKFSQPYSQYLVQARAYVRKHLSLVVTLTWPSLVQNLKIMARMIEWTKESDFVQKTYPSKLGQLDRMISVT